MRTLAERNRTAFTLVELLVIIVIIGILAALFLPVLSRAKGQSQSASCKNRLRQIGISLAMYVSDHHRYPPMWGDDVGYFQTWADRLFPYAPLNWTNRSWHCATYTAKGGIIQVRKPHSGPVVLTSYAYNAYGVAGLDGSPKLGLGIWSPTTLASEPEVLAPSEMYTVGDTRTYRDLFIGGVGVVNGLLGRIEMQPYYVQTEETSSLHDNGYNILFGDSHVALVKRKDYLYPPRTARNWNRDNQPHPEAWAPRKEWAVQN